MWQRAYELSVLRILFVLKWFFFCLWYLMLSARHKTAMPPLNENIPHQMLYWLFSINYTFPQSKCAANIQCQTMEKLNGVDIAMSRWLFTSTHSNDNHWFHSFPSKWWVKIKTFQNGAGCRDFNPFIKQFALSHDDGLLAAWIIR